MKCKRKLLVVASHILVLAGFSLLQGCATGECPIDWLNWPYNSPTDEPRLVSSGEYDDSLLLPPVVSVAADPGPVDSVFFTEPVVTEPFVTPPVVTEPVIAAGPSQTYIVQKGDTLSAIASMYGTSWKKLAEFNGLSNPNKLFVNQKIQIPGSLSASAPVVRSSSPSTSWSASSSGSPIKQGSSYVIQRGDTLSGIAKRAGLNVQEIQAANALDSHVIIAGKSLSIPKKGEVSVPSPTKAVETVPAIESAPEPAPAPAPIADIAPLAPAASAPVYEHVLYPGETLEDVARQYGSSKDEIMMLNGITSEDTVKPGTKLLVPIPE